MLNRAEPQQTDQSLINNKKFSKTHSFLLANFSNKPEVSQKILYSQNNLPETYFEGIQLPILVALLGLVTGFLLSIVIFPLLSLGGSLRSRLLPLEVDLDGVGI